jgi:hypothetical protein
MQSRALDKISSEYPLSAAMNTRSHRYCAMFYRSWVAWRVTIQEKSTAIVVVHNLSFEDWAALRLREQSLELQPIRTFDFDWGINGFNSSVVESSFPICPRCFMNTHSDVSGQNPGSEAITTVIGESFRGCGGSKFRRVCMCVCIVTCHMSLLFVSLKLSALARTCVRHLSLLFVI